MMLAIPELGVEYSLGEFSLGVLVVENKQWFRKLIMAFYDDLVDDYITFSENFEPFAFSKKGLFISNPVKLDFSAKKLNAKINGTLETLAEDELAEKLFDLKSGLASFAEDLVRLTDYSLAFEDEIDTGSIIKLLGCFIAVSDFTTPEKFVTYLQLCSEYLNICFFAVQNLHLYFTDNEIELINEFAALHHIKLLSVENIQPSHILKCELTLIVDNDLCVIDSEKNL